MYCIAEIRNDKVFRSFMEKKNSLSCELIRAFLK